MSGTVLRNAGIKHGARIRKRAALVYP